LIFYIKKETERAIKESIGLTLEMDGWSNIKRNSIINIVVCTPKPYFIKGYETGSERHTALKLTDIMDEQIIKLGKV